MSTRQHRNDPGSWPPGQPGDAATRRKAGFTQPGPTPIEAEPSPDELFVIPPKARHLDPRELQASTRLEAVFRHRNLKRLGDLHGVPVRQLWSLRNCGRVTIAELRCLIQRAGAGEFEVRKAKFSPARCQDLLRRVDRLMAELEPRDLDIVQLRMGTTERRPPTLAVVGAKYGLTRERVRQIVDEKVYYLRKAGGPPLLAGLRGVESICRARHRPLTAKLLSEWLGDQAGSLRLPVPAYVRLLKQLIQAKVDPHAGRRLRLQATARR